MLLREQHCSVVHVFYMSRKYDGAGTGTRTTYLTGASVDIDTENIYLETQRYQQVRYVRACKNKVPCFVREHTEPELMTQFDYKNIGEK